MEHVNATARENGVCLILAGGMYFGMENRVRCVSLMLPLLF